MSGNRLRALASDLTDASKRVREMAGLAIQKTVFDIEADAKALAPVDTGYLKSSISTELSGDGLRGEVGPTALYSRWVEEGTTRASAQPFLGPATDRRIPGFLQAMEQIGVEVLDG